MTSGEPQVSVANDGREPPACSTALCPAALSQAGLVGDGPWAAAPVHADRRTEGDCRHHGEHHGIPCTAEAPRDCCADEQRHQQAGCAQQDQQAGPGGVRRATEATAGAPGDPAHPEPGQEPEEREPAHPCGDDDCPQDIGDDAIWPRSRRIGGHSPTVSHPATASGDRGPGRHEPRTPSDSAPPERPSLGTSSGAAAHEVVPASSSTGLRPARLLVHPAAVTRT